MDKPQDSINDDGFNEYLLADSEIIDMKYIK